ncbi:hypothetical protein ACFQ8W_01775 [Streptomyces sp. NPDC056508]|uniref:hypothetical protein n=1 Tax=Streptomyces sp. NPDC056508 TaxID=3345845 RepID=UPI0036CA688D
MLTTDGSWIQLEADPLKPYEELDDWDKSIKAAGYYHWTTVGRPDEVPLCLDIHRHGGSPEFTGPEFLVVITTREYVDSVYAESLPAVMDLQVRWAPALQAAAVTELIGQLNDTSTKYGIAGLIRNALT